MFKDEKVFAVWVTVIVVTLMAILAMTVTVLN